MDEFRRQAQGPESAHYIPPARTRFEPEKWNDFHVAGTTGSLAYALNLPSVGMALPGELNHAPLYETPLPKLDQNDLTLLMGRDGAWEVPVNCIPDDGSHIIAVRYGDHFEGGRPGLLVMRRDDNGLFSYKHDFALEACNRRRGILNVDFNGEPLADPATANFKGLDKFGGYWSIPYEGVPFKPRIGIPSSLGFGDYPVPDDDFRL